MSSRAIERALKKERLQQQSRALRDDWAQQARGVEPAFAAADAAVKGWQWLKAHPVVPVAVVVAVVVIKPALVWRLGQGAWAGWQTWQRWRHLIEVPAKQADEPQ